MYNPVVILLRRKLLTCLFFVLALIAVYWQTTCFDFVIFDDKEYVLENPFIQDGVTFPTIYWAFTEFYSANWHPLTWLSHAFDISLFGGNAGGHHFVNVIFHLANSLVLYAWLNFITGSPWRSVAVAILFAFHPLNVESVAWASQRKTLLCAFLGLLAFFFYGVYKKRKRMEGYWLALLCFMLSLLAKPMMVTLPFILLLLDYWPFDQLHKKDLGLKKAIAEKVPFFVLTTLSCIVTFLAQKSSEAVASLHVYPISVRLSNAAISYLRYVWKLVWPVDLAVFYPHTGKAVYAWQAWTSCILIVMICATAFLYRKKHPWIIVGWLWFLGAMVPVIGLVQVGSQSMADRYAYIPFIGLFILIAWSVPEKFAHKKQIILLGAATVATCLLMMVSWCQARHWQDSVSLFKRVVAVSPGSQMGHFNLAVAFEEKGKKGLAEAHYKTAIQINPKHVGALNNLGLILVEKGDPKKAITYYIKALRSEPGNHKILNNLGAALMKQGKHEFALHFLVKALKIDPMDAQTHNNLGVALYRLDKFEASLKHFEKAVELSPHFLEALKNLKKMRKALGIRDQS